MKATHALGRSLQREEYDASASQDQSGSAFRETSSKEALAACVSRPLQLLQLQLPPLCDSLSQLNGRDAEQKCAGSGLPSFLAHQVKEGQPVLELDGEVDREVHQRLSQDPCRETKKRERELVAPLDMVDVLKQMKWAEGVGQCGPSPAAKKMRLDMGYAAGDSAAR